MRVRHEIRIAVAALLGLQLVTAIAGAWLLLRTGPAIRHILAENDVSLEAVEQMRGVMALRGIGPLEATRHVFFDDALARARRNITEPEEPAAIEIIEARAKAALDGDPEARTTVLEALDTLAAINRSSMRRADERAHGLARAGAWSLVGLALTTLALGLMMIRRVRERLFGPLARLYRVALAWTRGESHQRCGDVSMPEELGVIAHSLDALLDALHRKNPARDPGSRLDRDALVAVLEVFDGPAVVVHKGDVIAANTAGLDLARRIDEAEGVDRRDLGGGIELVRRPG